MPNCAIYGCNNHNRMNKGNAEIKFYRFPKNKDLSREWVRACCRAEDNINLKHAAICSKHFESKCFFTSLKYRLLNETPPKRFRNLRSDAIPTLFLPKTTATAILPRSSSNNNYPSKLSESEKMQAENNLRNRPIVAEILSNSNDNPRLGQIGHQAVEESVTNNFSKETSEVIKEMANMKMKILSLEKEVEDLKLKNKKLKKDKLLSDLKVLSIDIALSNHFTPGQIKKILNTKGNYLSRALEDFGSKTSLL
ncbi:THAP domain-containing protein 2-like [Anoplophora glabripennis]|uniref:THAP domain-containing protein 2-like n=1 Tax=Anoplophora glabripennis TaxID=217634 RepID=UPI0008741F7A|nr:THAP domain-containing protein 2-like [Anoplophora glabripennis]